MSTDEQQQPSTATRRRKRARKVDVQALRRDLLSTCSRYLEETPLGELNAAMVKAIGEVCGSVGPEYEKHERSASPAKALGGFTMPFDVPGTEQPTGVLPSPGAASPANGFPSVPLPSVKGTSSSNGGIKPPHRYASSNDYGADFTGLQRPE